MSIRRWVVWDPIEQTHWFFDSASEANDKAKSILQVERDCAGDGWSEETTEIFWGEVRESVIEGERQYPLCVECDEEAANCKCEEFQADMSHDYTVDYEFHPVEIERRKERQC